MTWKRNRVAIFGSSKEQLGSHVSRAASCSFPNWAGNLGTSRRNQPFGKISRPFNARTALGEREVREFASAIEVLSLTSIAVEAYGREAISQTDFQWSSLARYEELAYRSF